MAERTPIPAGAYEHLIRQLRADMQRKQFLEQMQAARQAEDMKGRHSVGPDERRAANPSLISNALTAAPMMGALGALTRGALPAAARVAPTVGRALVTGSTHPAALAAGAGIGGGLEYALNDKATAGDVAGMAALGAFDVANPVASIGAQVLGYSPEGQAMPFHSWMKYLKNARGELGDTALIVNPSMSELVGARKEAREFFPESPTVRIMRRMQNGPDETFAWDGGKLLHKDVAAHLNEPLSNFTGWPIYPDESLESRFRALLDHPPIRKAGGGVIKRLGKRAMSQFDELRPSSVAPQGALSVVKPKGGNWLAGSVESALSPLKEHLGEVDPARLAVIRERLGDPTAGNVGEVLNSWIEGPLTKYVKPRMASPEDEVRRLAEQGVLHFEPQGIRERSPLMEKIVARREGAGFPLQGLADSPLTDQWEKYADAAIARHTALDLSAAERDATFGGKQVPKDTVVHAPIYNQFGPHAVENLGFNHLIDELSNALNPNSGLPRNLQLTPEAVKQMSMEKAVRRVADINAWRAEQQAAANAELANKAMVVREYTDPALPNPKGLRWVELKALEGDTVDYYEAAKKQAIADGVDPKDPDFEDIVDEYISGVANDYGADFNMKHNQGLADQLKYEGDTMGHCVGGYCPDVLEGRSRIFSPRDAKGEPHVTVEVEPYQKETWAQRLASKEYDSIFDQAQKELGFAEGEHLTDSAKLKQLTDKAQEIASAKYGEPQILNRITQIKGKQNRKPNDEYLPFVQDFVRNSPLGGAWSDVGDLQNAGLTGIGGKYFSEPELRKAYDAAGFSIPFEGLGMDYMDMIARKNLQADRADAAFLQALGFDFKPIQKASGGAVTKQPNPADNFQGIIAAIEEALA